MAKNEFWWRKRFYSSCAAHCAPSRGLSDRWRLWQPGPVPSQLEPRPGRCDRGDVLAALVRVTRGRWRRVRVRPARQPSAAIRRRHPRASPPRADGRSGRLFRAGAESAEDGARRRPSRRERSARAISLQGQCRQLRAQLKLHSNLNSCRLQQDPNHYALSTCFLCSCGGPRPSSGSGQGQGLDDPGASAWIV